MTLFYAIFFPVFWIILFGSATIFFVVIPLFNPQTEGIMDTKYLYLICLLMGLLFYFLFGFRLRRVDADEGALYVTNYFKTVRIPLELVSSVQFRDRYILRMARINLTQPGYFGKTIRMVERENQFELYALQHNLTIPKLTRITKRLKRL